jgi:hypothetical protein
VIATRGMQRGEIILCEDPLLKCLYKNREALVSLVLMFPNHYSELCDDSTKCLGPTQKPLKDHIEKLQVNGRSVTTEQWEKAGRQVATNMFCAGRLPRQTEAGSTLDPDHPIYLGQRDVSAFNHDSNPNVDWPMKKHTFTYKINRDVKQGEELCIFYSDEANIQFKAGAGPTDLDGGDDESEPEPEPEVIMLSPNGVRYEAAFGAPCGHGSWKGAGMVRRGPVRAGKHEYGYLQGSLCAAGSLAGFFLGRGRGCFLSVCGFCGTRSTPFLRPGSLIP